MKHFSVTSTGGPEYLVASQPSDLPFNSLTQNFTTLSMFLHHVNIFIGLLMQIIGGLKGSGK